MALIDVELPQLGETVEEGTLTRWFKQVGDTVTVDELLYEVSTEKVDAEVPSPVTGTIIELKVAEGETITVGTVLAVVEGEFASSTPEAVTQDSNDSVNSGQLPPTEPSSDLTSPGKNQSTKRRETQNEASDTRLLSPVVRRLIKEHGLETARIQGTGLGGRITRNDVLNVIDERHRDESATPDPQPNLETASRTSRESQYVAFNSIRRATANHMTRSAHSSPHAMTVMEVDYENVERVRSTYRETWRAEHGFSLTYLPFIMRAVVEALEEWPYLNASVEDEGLRVHADINIGVAVDLDYEGLIVPVVRQADGLRLEALALAVNNLASGARNRRLSLDDISAGTFTISNNGAFGTYTTAAIINQPQVAVLSTDGVTRRPVVIADQFGNESIAIHSVGHLAMAWDHRAFDGSYAAGFLSTIKRAIETRDWEVEL
jgi:2-oxoglutarate dehydrogenase E2 component (dihydrolipoamide succinyltransferase)